MKIKKLSKKSIVILILIMVVLIASIILLIICKKEKTVGHKEKKNTNSVDIKEEKAINIVDMNSNKRPIAIMIDNNVGNDKHAGLQNAYLTYEIIVEGGLTRIMAIFKDKDISEIGPVRSSRHYFLDYALESDAIYCHFGWSPYAKNDISSLKVNNINGLTASGAYWRDNNIAAPHNVFTSTQKIYETATNYGYNVTTDNWNKFTYTTDNIELNEIKCKDNCDYLKEVTVAKNININYSAYQNRSYKYDEEKQIYLRSMNNVAHTDKNTKEQYNYKNIIIERVKNQSLDQKDRQDLTTVGSGEGYYITNGYSIPITWSKTGRKEKTVYKYKNGDIIKINDGNTFIQIIPTTSSVTID